MFDIGAMTPMNLLLLVGLLLVPGGVFLATVILPLWVMWQRRRAPEAFRTESERRRQPER